MPIKLEDFDDEVVDHVKNKGVNLLGIDAPIGAYKGKRINDSAKGVCGLIRWMRDNTDYVVTVVMEFTDSGSELSVVFRRANGNAVVKTIGPHQITGKRMSDRGFAERHEIIGYRALLNVAEKIEKKLIADGEIQ